MTNLKFLSTICTTLAHPLKVRFALSTPIRIRAATHSDLTAIADLLLELSRAEGGTTAIGEEELAQAMFAPDARVQLYALVAEREGAILGTILYYWGYDVSTASDGIHLADMIVTQAAQRQKIGSKLYTALARQCLAQGGQWISLTALKSNATAKKFYRNQGMKQIAVDFFAIGPTGLTKL